MKKSIVAIVFLSAFVCSFRSQAAPVLADLNWLAGSWSGVYAGSKAELQFMDSSGDVILGAFRLSKGNEVYYAELPQVQVQNGIMTLLPHPLRKLAQGSVGESYPLKEYSRNRVVFENATADFPKTIIYQRIDSRTLLYRVEGKKDGFPPFEEYELKNEK